MTITCDLPGHSAPNTADSADPDQCDIGCVDLCEHGLQLRIDHEVPIGTTLFIGISQTDCPFSHVTHGPVYRRAGLVVDCTRSPRHGEYDLTIFFLDDTELGGGEEAAPDLLEA